MKRILAIDDSPVILSLIQDILSNNDYQVETADNAQDALEKYASFKPHVVTLDLAMPLVDGYQILKRLKDLDKKSTVIMITASEHSSALQDCLESGAVGYIAKPFKPKELVDIIERTLETANGHDENMISMFSLITDKIQLVMDGMFPSLAAIVSMENIQVLHNISDHNDEASEASRKAELTADMTVPSSEQISFLTEIDGQAIGTVISSIKKSDLEFLFSTFATHQESVIVGAKEFFNIVNTKVLSQLAEATRLKLKTKPTMYMSRPSEKDHFWKSTSNLWDQIAKATFRIEYKNRDFLIDIQLWYDAGRIFQS